MLYLFFDLYKANIKLHHPLENNHSTVGLNSNLKFMLTRAVILDLEVGKFMSETVYTEKKNHILRSFGGNCSLLTTTILPHRKIQEIISFSF